MSKNKLFGNFFLAFVMGGGTVDVSLLTIDEQAKGSTGNSSTNYDERSRW